MTCWWMIGTCGNGTGLVTALLKGLKQRVRARNDGTRLASVGRNSHDKFIHELTGALLDPEQVRLAEIEEVEFLHTFPVYEKVCESELKGTGFALTRWILTDKRTCQATRHSRTLVRRGFRWNSIDMENSFAVTPQVGITEIHFVTVSKRAGVWGVITVITRRMATSRVGRITCAFPSQRRRELYTRLPTADSKPGHVGNLLRSLYGMRDAINAWDGFRNTAAIYMGTKLDCHHHACTYGSDVARSDGQKQVGPSPSSAVGPNTGEESASNEQSELSRRTPQHRLYPVAQWLPTVHLRGLISLVVSPVLGFVHGPRLSRFVLTSRVLERTHWRFWCDLLCRRVQDSHGWRHGHGQVPKAKKTGVTKCRRSGKVWWSWRDVPKLEWRASDDKLVTIFNRLAHQQDNGGNQCVAPEPGPRRIDWLREARGLNAKAHAVSTLGDKKLDNYDETSFNASEATSLRSWTMRLVFCCSRHPSVCGEQTCVTHAKLTVEGWNRLRICVRCIHGHSQWIPPKKDDGTLQSIRSSSRHHPSEVDRTSTMANSDKAESSYEWWHMRWPTQKTWKVFFLCFRPY